MEDPVRFPMATVPMNRAAIVAGSIRGLLDRGVYCGHLHIGVLHPNLGTMAIQNRTGIFPCTYSFFVCNNTHS